MVWDDSVPTITPNRVPVLSWGPRILGEAGGASKDSLMEANNQFDDGVSEPQDIGAGEAASSVEVENPGDVDCVNVRYLRSYIDGTQQLAIAPFGPGDDLGEAKPSACVRLQTRRTS